MSSLPNRKRQRTTSFTFRKPTTARARTSSLTAIQRREVAQLAKGVVAKNTEIKKFWHSGSALVVYTPIITSLLSTDLKLINPFYPIAQGTADYNRVGDTITPKNVHVKLSLEQQSGRQDSSMYCRVIAFWSSSQVACYSVGASIWDDSSSLNPPVKLFINLADGTPQHNNSFLDYDNITPVYDKIHVVPQNQASVSSGINAQRKYIDLKFPMSKKKLQFWDGISGTGNQGYLKGKNFYVGIMVDSPSAPGATALLYCEAHCLVTFTDS